MSVAGTNGAFLSASGTQTGSPGVTGKLFISEVAPWSSGNSPIAADWFEVIETRGTIQNGRVSQFQVTIKVGFRVMSPEELRGA